MVNLALQWTLGIMKTRARLSMIAATLLLSLPQMALAREARVLTFSFEIPDPWHYEGSGGDRLFATGAQKPYEPPLVLAEACVSSPQNACASLESLDPANDRELAKVGCRGAVAQRFTWNEITETRWVCASRVDSGAQIIGGVSIFRFNGAILYLAYLAGDGDTKVEKFLDQVGRSMKVKP